MNLYELLTLLVSVFALIVSAASLIRTRSIAAEQLKLERITAELSQAQLAEIEERGAQKNLPKLAVNLTKLGDNYFVIVTNTGQGAASEVDLRFLSSENPISSSHDRLPHPELRPGTRLKLPASVYIDSPDKFEALLSWVQSGQKQSEVHWLTL